MSSPTDSPSQTHYPKVSFKKCILLNHQKTISILSLPSSRQLNQNPTIKQCLNMHYNDERHKIFTFLAAIVMMKIGTKIVHMNRALALSAPRNWTSVLFKYVCVPYMFSMYKYMGNIQRTIMEIDGQIGEDPEADELWQPLFEKTYPNVNQPLYSSPFSKFNLEDVLRETPSQKAIL